MNIAVKKWWLDAVNQPVDDGYNYLIENSIFFYDFNNLTGSNGDAIANGNDGLIDLGPNQFTTTIKNIPKVATLTYNGVTVNCLEDYLTNCIELHNDGSDLFTRNKYRFFFLLQTGDGRNSTHHLFGGVESVATNVGMNVYIDGAGKLFIAMGNSQGWFQWGSTNAIWNDGLQGLSLVEISVDFDANTVSMFNMGYNIGSSHNAGTTNISTWDSSIWTNTKNMLIGSRLNVSSADSNSFINKILACALVPELTSDQLNDVRDWFYNKYAWENEIHISNQTDVDTKRADLISTIFNGSGLLALTPTVATGHTGVMHTLNSSSLTGFSTITKYTFTHNDINSEAWTNICYRLYSSSPNGKCVINSMGHGENTTGHINLINELLSDGYDVIFVAPPVCGENTEASSVVNSTGVTGHNQILSGGIDRVGYNALELFLFDKTSIVDYVDADYDAIYMTGISGGGWMSTIMGAIDTRIKRIASCRGTAPITFKDASLGHVDPDFEQGGTLFTNATSGSRIQAMYEEHSYLDLYLMNTDNRRFLIVNHEQDTCCHRGDTYRVYNTSLTEKASALNGQFSMIWDTIDANKSHFYSSLDITNIVNFFNEA